MQRLAFSLTTKIVLLVAFMGAAFGLITLYTTWHMQRIEGHHQQLLRMQAHAAGHIGKARHYLGHAALVVHRALMAELPAQVEQAQQAQEALTETQQQFQAELSALYPLLPEYHLQLDAVNQQGQQMFFSGQRVLSTHMDWQDSRALHTLSQSFVPALDLMLNEMHVLRTHAQEVFARSSQELDTHTQRTIRNTMLASWSIALLISALAAWIALRWISQPIARLTKSMRHLRFQQYDTPIADLERRDEIGSMARTLKRFAKALQEADGLQRELAVHQQDRLLVEQLQQLTSALPGAVFQMHVRHGEPMRLRFVSPQWVSLLGLPAGSPANVESASFYLRGHDPQLTAVSEQHFARSAQTMEPVDFEVSMDMLDGVTRWIKTRANPHLESDGSVLFNGVWLDVTKEVQQARALEKAKRQAEQDAQARSILQASISHEIRTPLNAILGLTQLMLKAKLPQMQREQLENVFRAAQHLRGIVNEVLDYSKIDAGQLQLESTDFSLESVVLDVVHMCQEEASKKGLQLRYAIDSELPDSLRGDPHRIAQILLNYVNNAIKFTTSGQIDIVLTLGASSNLHRVELRAEVTDTGLGIPADRLDLLFDAYQQADNSITRRFGGTGLGLTISRALAQLMGGSVGVSSVLGQGSTFWFTAVLEPARSVVKHHNVTTVSDVRQTGHWHGLRILVVDDNSLNRAVAEGMLHALGLQTETAEDGAQALLKLQAAGPQYYSCVLMDIQMPHLDGYSATETLRKMPGFEHLPVLAMTAHTAVQDVQRAHAAGMNGHLAKPLLESALRDALHRHLNHIRNAALDAMSHTPEPALAIPPVFDAVAIDALAQLFDTSKLHQLTEQFVRDSTQRAHALPTLAEQQDWAAMRAEAHKLTGTAATFGLLQLGHWSAALSTALKSQDYAKSQEISALIVEATNAGVEQLQQYICASMAKT